MNVKYFIPAFLMICLFTGCRENSTAPTPVSYDFSLLGKPGIVRTYYSTIALVLPGTNIPFLVPPDSLKSVINFPDTLYQKGVFVYTTDIESTAVVSDTFVVSFSASGYNLYQMLLQPAGSSYGSNLTESYTQNYILLSNRIYSWFNQNVGRELVYDLPLTPGKSYIADYNQAVYSVVGDETVTTRAGTFQTIKLQIVREPNSVYSINNGVDIFYICPKVGVVLYESRYLRTSDKPTDHTINQVVEQFQRRELISIN
jgi:hypothetical protein